MKSLSPGRFLPGGLKPWLTILSLGFVSYAVYINSQNISNLELTTYSYLWLSFGVVFSFFSLVCNAIAWKSLLFWLGYNSKKLDLIGIFLSSNILKYLPGGVWHFVDRLRTLKNSLGAGRAIASVFLEPILMVAAALLWFPFGEWQSGLSLICLIPSLLFLSRFREPLLHKLESLKIGQLNKIDPGLLPRERNFDYEIERLGYPFAPLILEMFFVFLRFLGFWCTLNAFSIATNLTFFKWLSIFSLAWTIGLVVPAAPGGIGVFESVFLVRVDSIVPEASLLACLLCYRFISILSDFLAALTSSKIKLGSLFSSNI